MPLNLCENSPKGGRRLLVRILALVVLMSPPILLAADSYFAIQKQLAKAGDPIAQYGLAVMYANGEGVPKNSEKAIEWYRIAANQRIDVRIAITSQYYMGEMYFSGVGVPKDLDKALEWYTKAAKQGHSQAQFTLAELYFAGEVVPQDSVKAVDWCVKAADQDHLQAQYNLSERYANGRGVPQDYMQAYAWITIASMKDATSLPIREKLEKLMSRDQIEQAQKTTKQIIERMQLKL